jgi:hypothetical protein
VDGVDDGLYIELKTEEEMEKDPAYKNIRGLSGYLPGTKTVTINNTNWMYGHIKSNMECCSMFDIAMVDSDEYKIYIDNPVTLEDYRNYVINHEVGHHLQSLVLKQCGGKFLIEDDGDPYHYRPDPQLTDNKMPIMIQLTKGKRNLLPFVHNYFPLDITEKYNEFYNIMGNISTSSSKISGGAPALCLLMYSINIDMLKMALLICFIIIMLYYVCKKKKISCINNTSMQYYRELPHWPSASILAYVR